MAPRIEIYTQIACDTLHPIISPPQTNFTVPLVPLHPLTPRDCQSSYSPSTLDSSMSMDILYNPQQLKRSSEDGMPVRAAKPSNECLHDPAVQSRAAGIQASVSCRCTPPRFPVSDILSNSSWHHCWNAQHYNSRLLGSSLRCLRSDQSSRRCCIRHDISVCRASHVYLRPLFTLIAATSSTSWSRPPTRYFTSMRGDSYSLDLLSKGFWED